MTEAVIAPLTPPECDISDWPAMMLDVARLQKSRAWLICKSKPHLAFYMFNLWMEAWQDVPAASLENDDEVLADKARCRDVQHWLEIKTDVLRGFVVCSDGRLYHEVIAIKALEAWVKKLGSRISSGAGNAKLWNGTFDATTLRQHLQVAKDMLAALDPASRVLSRSRAGIAKTDAEAPKKPTRARKPATREAAPAVGSTGDVPAGGGPDAAGIAREEKGREEKGIEEVGGKPPTTPSADAPGGDGAATESKPPRKPPIDMANRNLVLPDWLAPHAVAWGQFEENRWAKHSRAPYTLAAQRGILAKLEKLRDDGQDLHEVLMASVRNSWTDVFAQRTTARVAGPAGGAPRFAGASKVVFGASREAGDFNA